MSKFISGLVIGIVLPILLLLLLFTNQRKSTMVKADNISTLEVYDLNNNRISMDSLNKNGVFINFWATWCAPCIKEMPIFDELEKSGRASVVAVSNENNDIIKRFVEKNDFTFTIAHYKFTDGTKINILPTTILIDETNNVIWSKRGSITKKMLEEALSQIKQE